MWEIWFDHFRPPIVPEKWIVRIMGKTSFRQWRERILGGSPNFQRLSVILGNSAIRTMTDCRSEFPRFGSKAFELVHQRAERTRSRIKKRWKLLFRWTQELSYSTARQPVTATRNFHSRVFEFWHGSCDTRVLRKGQWQASWKEESCFAKQFWDWQPSQR